MHAVPLADTSRGVQMASERKAVDATEAVMAGTWSCSEMALQ